MYHFTSYFFVIYVVFLLGLHVDGHRTDAYFHSSSDFNLPSKPNWMAGISDLVFLNQLTVPGTHDSGIRYIFACIKKLELNKKLINFLFK